MPFQSMSSLKAARKLKNDEITKRAPQNHVDVHNASTLLTRLVLGRELENHLALADHPLLPARDLLQVCGVVVESIDDLGQLLGLLPQARVVALERVELLVHVTQATHALPAVDSEPGEEKQAQRT